MYIQYILLHCHQKLIVLTGLSVLELEVFVGKLLSINALTAGAVMISEIATLKHEVRNHTVENASFIAVAFLSSTESTEIFNCFRNSFAVEL